MKRPKLNDVSTRVRDCIDRGDYRVTAHALRRIRERDITGDHVFDLLLGGRREPRKDQYHACTKHGIMHSLDKSRMDEEYELLSPSTKEQCL